MKKADLMKLNSEYNDDAYDDASKGSMKSAHKELVERLLANTGTSIHQTTMHLCIKDNMINALRCIFHFKPQSKCTKFKIRYNSRTLEVTPLDMATRYRRYEMMDMILLGQTYDKVYDKTYCLYFAVKNNDLKAVRILLDAGFSAQSFCPWSFPVIAYCDENRKYIGDLLISFGANPDAFQYEGAEVPLVAAIYFGKADLVRNLIHYGADVHLHEGYPSYLLGAVIHCLDRSIHENRENKSYTPDLSILKFILEKVTAILSSKLYNSNSRWIEDNISRIVLLSSVEVLEIVLPYIDNINYQDCNGVTALHTAAELMNLDIIKILLEHGADATIKSSNGDTALDYASRRKERESEMLKKSIEAVKLLSEHASHFSSHSS